MKKILLAEFKHETNRLSPIITDEKSFRDRSYLFGRDIVERSFGARTEMGAFLDLCGSCEDVEYVPVIAFNATPSGPVAQAVFDTALSSLLKALDENPDTAGILLALHGAMVTEGSEDGEGTLMEALRKKVGPDVPIMASLDLHTNITYKMVENATALFPYDYYPHTDSYEAAYRAADCMIKTLRGELKPVMRCRKLDLLLQTLGTSLPVIEPYVKKTQAMRNEPGIINVNFCHGFFFSDIYEAGASVIAVTDGDAELAQKIADELGEEIWNDREKLVLDYTDLDEAIDIATAGDEKTFVFADVNDNPGAGASGDSTHILRRFIERGVKDVVVATIFDPETAAQAAAAGIGATIDAKIGGKIDPAVNGEPVECKAYVKALTDGKFATKDYCPGTKLFNGISAVLVVGGIEIIVNSLRTQPYDMEVIRASGITPEDKKIIIVKSAVHFRASYSKIACRIFNIDKPALARQDVLTAGLKHVRRPIYPLDK